MEQRFRENRDEALPESNSLWHMSDGEFPADLGDRVQDDCQSQAEPDGSPLMQVSRMRVENLSHQNRQPETATLPWSEIRDDIDSLPSEIILGCYGWMT